MIETNTPDVGCYQASSIRLSQIPGSRVPRNTIAEGTPNEQHRSDNGNEAGVCGLDRDRLGGGEARRVDLGYGHCRRRPLNVMLWALVWKIVLILTLAVFALMSLFVTIGGAADIRRLFRSLREGKDES